ncbi:MAG TPA: hypothetical protein VJ904_09290, partial [Tichowtungia sp.]|nr:hypothetical protein [Tichowtungia sp.]
MKKQSAIWVLLWAISCGWAMAQNVQPVQTYYVPMPEEDLRTFLAAIDTGGAYAGSDIYNYISIAAIADDTLIYWDQSENGFEFNFSNPQDLYSAANPDGTQIWGDGNVTNGAPPGVPGDLISAGTVIVIEELVPDSPPGGSVYFGAGDRIGATKPISVVRAGWGSVRDTLHGGAVEVYDTSNWSTNYIVPLGTDTAGDNSMFEYVGLFIQAATDGTTLSIDSDADGTTDDTTTIDQGESYFVSGLQEGATVAANHPVQVDVMTGDVGSTYEARYFPLSPESLWADRYLSPVGTPSSTPNTQDTGLWLFNPGSAQITVTLEYRTSGNVLTTATQAV